MRHYGKNLVAQKVILDVAITDKLKALAKSEERSFSSLVRRILAKGLDEAEGRVDRAA